MFILLYIFFNIFSQLPNNDFSAFIPIGGCGAAQNVLFRYVPIEEIEGRQLHLKIGKKGIIRHTLLFSVGSVVSWNVRRRDVPKITK